jgi:hypothetical protein
VGCDLVAIRKGILKSAEPAAGPDSDFDLNKLVLSATHAYRSGYRRGGYNFPPKKSTGGLHQFLADRVAEVAASAGNRQPASASWG